MAVGGAYYLLEHPKIARFNLFGCKISECALQKQRECWTICQWCLWEVLTVFLKMVVVSPIVVFFYKTHDLNEMLWRLNITWAFSDWSMCWALISTKHYIILLFHVLTEIITLETVHLWHDRPNHWLCGTQMSRRSTLLCHTVRGRIVIRLSLLLRARK